MARRRATVHVHVCHPYHSLPRSPGSRRARDRPSPRRRRQLAIQAASHRWTSPPAPRFRIFFYPRAMDVLVNIDVDDLARAEAFYTTAFDLTPARRFGVGALELVGASSKIYLLVNPPDSFAPASGALRNYDRHWTPVHLDIVVDDVDAAVARACAAGAMLEHAAKDTRWGRIAVLADPFGHGLCILAFRGAGYDAIATPA